MDSLIHGEILVLANLTVCVRPLPHTVHAPCGVQLALVPGQLQAANPDPPFLPTIASGAVPSFARMFQIEVTVTL